MSQTRREFLTTTLATGSLMAASPALRGLAGGAGSPAPAAGHTIILPGRERLVDVPGLPTLFFIEGRHTDSRFSLVEHILEPKVLGSPLHRHHREDEFSYILEGEVTVQLGDDVLTAGPGTLVFKPRNEWHAFWNQGTRTAKFLEIISPAGFERFFEELALPEFRNLPYDAEVINDAIVRIGRRYELDFDMEGMPELMKRHGLTS